MLLKKSPDGVGVRVHCVMRADLELVVAERLLWGGQLRHVDVRSWILSTTVVDSRVSDADVR
jgi:hypothetical protein